MSKYLNKEQIEKNTKRYTNKEQAFRALLGGIGTGNISIDGSARLCDFEIHNHPDKKLKIPYTFFSLWSHIGDEIKAMVLEAAPEGISDKALGHPTGELIGLPRFDRCSISTQYPFYQFSLERDGYPLKVSLTAYTPFIPLNSQDSGIPGFQMKYQVENTAKQPAEVSICGTMYNDIGFTAYDGFDKLLQKGKPVNTEKAWAGLKGILFDSEELAREDPTYGTMMLASVNQNVTVKPQWQLGGWWDGAEEF